VTPRTSKSNSTSILLIARFLALPCPCMNDRQSAKESSPAVEQGKAEPSTGQGAAPKLPAGGDAGASPSDDAAKEKKLTAEEQMALYEKDLKENDWGHQPC
jgi:hypothetical protein